MAETKIYTTSQVNTKLFTANSGEGYTTFSEAMVMDNKVVAGPRNFMVKTKDLAEFVELTIAAYSAWDKANQVEKETNAL